MRLILALILLSPGLLSANHHAAAPDPGAVGEVALPTTGSPDAQPWFLHGLAQLHNFEYGDAADYFREAQARDPAFALAYWGEAMTHNHPIWMQQDRDAALSILRRLAPTPEARVARAGSPLERDLLGAVEVLYGEGDKTSRDVAYRDRMAALHRKYADSADVGAFYALALLGTAHGGRDFAIYMQSAAITEQLFERHPRHPGVAHYLIHATDDPVHARLGLRAAKAYAAIAPNAAHAQHMTSHIFLALGLWDATALANDTAVSVVNRSREARGQQSVGCGHYPSWQMYAYLQLGRKADAAARMRLCHARTAGARPDAQQARGFYYMKSLYLVDSDDWSGEIASLEIPDTGGASGAFEKAYLDAMIALNVSAERARPSVQAVRTAYNTLLADIEPSRNRGEAIPGPNGTALLQVRMHLLEARLAETLGKVEAAEGHLRDAVTLEAGLPFGFGPPNPAKPALEALAELQLRLGQSDAARASFESALARMPNRTRSVQGLARARSAVSQQ